MDGDVFNWAGAASGPSVATETSAEYTSTKTVFTYDVNSKVTLTVTFLSPVYPNDLVKQSLQYSYIDVSAVASDGASHDVQVYLDCTGGMSLLSWNFAVSWLTGPTVQNGPAVVIRPSSLCGATALLTVCFTTNST